MPPHGDIIAGGGDALDMPGYIAPMDADALPAGRPEYIDDVLLALLLLCPLDDGGMPDIDEEVDGAPPP